MFCMLCLLFASNLKFASHRNTHAHTRTHTHIYIYILYIHMYIFIREWYEIRWTLFTTLISMWFNADNQMINSSSRRSSTSYHSCRCSGCPNLRGLARFLNGELSTNQVVTTVPPMDVGGLGCHEISHGATVEDSKP